MAREGGVYLHTNAIRDLICTLITFLSYLVLIVVRCAYTNNTLPATTDTEITAQGLKAPSYTLEKNWTKSLIFGGRQLTVLWVCGHLTVGEEEVYGGHHLSGERSIGAWKQARRDTEV